MAVKASNQITITDVTDVKSTCRYYLLQGSTLAKPARPTTNPPSSSWTKTEPNYTAGSTNSLYFTDLTVFSDDTFNYSDVSLSSSYEAAKTAYNRAIEAAKTSTNYIDYSSSDGLQVGNKTSGSWSGFRTQITSAAFNILNEIGGVVATYGAKLVELGKGASDAVIKFCNDAARLYVNEKGQAVLEAWSLLLSATNVNTQSKIDLDNGDGTTVAEIRSTAFPSAGVQNTAFMSTSAGADGTSKVRMIANEIEAVGITDILVESQDNMRLLASGTASIASDTDATISGGNSASVIGEQAAKVEAHQGKAYVHGKTVEIGGEEAVNIEGFETSVQGAKVVISSDELIVKSEIGTIAIESENGTVNVDAPTVNITGETTINGRDVLEEIDELNKNLGVKAYSNLTSIGLTDANVTKEALYGAIPNHSRLSKAVWKSNWTSFDFPSTAGNYIAIEFTKYDAGYACVELYDLYNNKKYLSSYNGSSKAWSDWSALN